MNSALRNNLILFLILAMAPLGAQADQADPTPPIPSTGTPAPAPEAPAPEAKPLGLTIELGFSTNYIFRGLNVFGDKQLDPNCMFNPSVTYAVPGTGLTFGWWGAFQTNGDNLGQKLALPLGGENDLWFNYNIGLPSDFGLDLGITAYLYPMAKESASGTGFPVFLEPRVGVAWNGPVTLSVNVMYFLGLQDAPLVRGSSYFYVLPKIAKLIPLHPMINLDLSLSYGFKYFINGNDGLGNVHDVMFKAGLPIRPWGKLYVTPGVGAAWTDLQGADAADGFAVYGFLNVGVEL